MLSIPMLILLFFFPHFLLLCFVVPFVQSEHLLLLSDQIDRIALFQHCDHHGSVQGGPVPATHWLKSPLITTEVLTHCHTRLNDDLIAFGHIFGSALRGPYTQGGGLSYHRRIKAALTTERRIQDALQEFRARYQQLPDRVVFHTTLLDGNNLFPRLKHFDDGLTIGGGVIGMSDNSAFDRKKRLFRSIGSSDKEHDGRSNQRFDLLTIQAVEEEGLQEFRTNTLYWMNYLQNYFSKIQAETDPKETYATKTEDKKKFVLKKKTKIVLRATPAALDDDETFFASHHNQTTAVDSSVSSLVQYGLAYRLSKMNAIVKELVLQMVNSSSSSLIDWYFYDMDEDLWSLATPIKLDTQRQLAAKEDERNEGWKVKKTKADSRLFFDNINPHLTPSSISSSGPVHMVPAKVFLSRYLEKILGIRYSSLIFPLSISLDSSVSPKVLSSVPFFPRIDLCFSPSPSHSLSSSASSMPSYEYHHTLRYHWQYTHPIHPITIIPPSLSEDEMPILSKPGPVLYSPSLQEILFSCPRIVINVIRLQDEEEDSARKLFFAAAVASGASTKDSYTMTDTATMAVLKNDTRYFWSNIDEEWMRSQYLSPLGDVLNFDFSHVDKERNMESEIKRIRKKITTGKSYQDHLLFNSLISAAFSTSLPTTSTKEESIVLDTLSHLKTSMSGNGVKVLTSTKKECYFLMDSCKQIMSLPMSYCVRDKDRTKRLENDFASFYDSLPLIENQSPSDDALLYWKYGQGNTDYSSAFQQGSLAIGYFPQVYLVEGMVRYLLPDISFHLHKVIHEANILLRKLSLLTVPLPFTSLSSTLSSRVWIESLPVSFTHNRLLSKQELKEIVTNIVYDLLNNNKSKKKDDTTSRLPDEANQDEDQKALQLLQHLHADVSEFLIKSSLLKQQDGYNSNKSSHFVLKQGNVTTNIVLLNQEVDANAMFLRSEFITYPEVIQCLPQGIAIKE